MIRRVLVPVEDSSGTRISAHFGRAPFFSLIEIDNGSVVSKTIVPNTGEHTGGVGHAHNNVLRYNPNTVIVHAMGPRGVEEFQSASVAVLKANSDLVDEIINAYLLGKLDELTDGCLEAQH